MIVNRAGGMFLYYLLGNILRKVYLTSSYQKSIISNVYCLMYIEGFCSAVPEVQVHVCHSF